MRREELVPAGHRHSTCGFEESEGDAHPLTPHALTPGPWGNLRPFLLVHWRSTCHSMRTLILASLVLLLSTRAAARARDRNRPNRNAACEGRRRRMRVRLTSRSPAYAISTLLRFRPVRATCSEGSLVSDNPYRSS